MIGEALWRLRTDSLIHQGYESAFAPGFDYEAAFGDPDQVVEDNRAMTYTSFDRAAAESDDFTDEGTVAARLTATGVPLLAILGADDQIVDTPASPRTPTGRCPARSSSVFDGVGHSANLEAPSETAELLLRFAGAAPSPREIAAAEARAERRAQRAKAAAKRKRQAARRRRAAKRKQAQDKRGGKSKNGDKNGGQNG